MRTVASFQDPCQAHLAKGKLESEGIPSVILDEHLVQMNWTLSGAVGGVKLQVLDEDERRAREILAKNDGENLSIFEESKIAPEQDELCPKCSSRNISQNRYSIWSLIPSILSSTPFFFHRKKWKCGECGETW